MQIGIIIHSHTGNTLAVAQRLEAALLAAGHRASIERVVAVNEDPSAANNVQLKTAPDVSEYDALFFGAPVRGFSLSPVMKAFLLQIPAMQDKKVGCFVTQQLPYAWMGGNLSIGQMKKACESKGAKVFETGIVNWSHKQREKKIEDALSKFVKI